MHKIQTTKFQLSNPISTMGDRLCPPHYYSTPQIFRPSAIPEKALLFKEKKIRCHNKSLDIKRKNATQKVLFFLHLNFYLIGSLIFGNFQSVNNRLGKIIKKYD